MRLLFGLSLALLAAAGCSRPPAIEITTRENGTFVVAEPLINYGRRCSEAWSDIVEQGGLRRRDRVVSWSSLESVEFAAKQPPGDPSCDRLLDAEVRYRDGRHERMQLSDTLIDFGVYAGLLGETERGRLRIRLEDIVRLRTVPNENWAWAQRQTTVNTPLRITTAKGEVHEFREPRITLPRSQSVGPGLVQTAPDMSVYGLPVWVSGAQITILWPELRQVESERGDWFRARVTYADGRTETVRVDQTGGALGSSVMLVDEVRGPDGNRRELPLSGVIRIEVIKLIKGDRPL